MKAGIFPYFIRTGCFFAASLCLFILQAQAFEMKLPELEESRAFQEYAVRPSSELSKLIYLIDRFKEAEVQIIYDGFHVTAPFAAGVAKWFLSRKYQGQAAERWILQWCDRTFGGNVIWAKDVRGNYKASREILLTELERLHEACRDRCGT